MGPIKVYINKEALRVDDDKETACKFSPFYLEKLSEKGTLNEDELARFGLDIFNNIFSTKERRERIRNRLNSIQGNETLVITISSEFEDLHNIPFEIINENGTETGFLLKRGNVSLVRQIPTLDKETSQPALPIRILVLLSLPIETYRRAPLNLLKELNVIYSALDNFIAKGLVVVDVEEKADKNTIRERVLHGEYDIIHFTGHGAKGGRLIIEDERTYTFAKPINAEEMGEIFKGSNVRLFYFDACETAMSSDFEPSLAYHIFKALPFAQVLANSLTVRDDLATAITGNIYKEIFKGKMANALNMARLRVTDEWWKPVIFCEPEKEIFKITEGEIEREKRARVVSRPPEPGTNYVYRYPIVREASSLIEKQNYLVLHGIGGAGKSTMAGYLSRFYDAKFRHILFIDLKEEGITTPERLLEEILRLIRKDGLIDLTIYQEILEKTKNLAPEDRTWERWNFIKKFIIEETSFPEKKRFSIKKTLLILDNIEEVLQDETGVIKRGWRDFISSLLQETGIFTIFTTRLRPYFTERKPLDNILEIGEYTFPEIIFLIQDLSEDSKVYLLSHFEEIKKSFGLHPLSFSRAIEERRENIQTLLDLSDFKKVFEFYRLYFNQYKKDTERLFGLTCPFSSPFMERIFSSDFVSLIKKRLLLLEGGDNHFLPYPVITSYFKKDFHLNAEGLKLLKTDILWMHENGHFIDIDLLNIFAIFMNYYENFGGKEIEEKLADILEGIGISNRMAQLSREDIERFIKSFKNFSLSPNTLATTLNNLGNLYSETGRPKEAESSYGEALRIYRELKDFGKQFSIYPRVIDSAAKIKPVNYRRLADYLCGFLDLFEAFYEKNKSLAVGMISFFIKERVVTLSNSVIQIF